MAVSYSRPGVFVNQSLTPLSSSSSGTGQGAVAAFAAPYNIGPVKPTLVQNWQSYTALFGGFNVASGSPLAYAVWQYFSNGGTQCFVLRVPNSDATIASDTIDSVVATLGDPALAPTVTAATTGGTVAAGTYEVQITYVNASGETLPSPAAAVITTGTTSTITVTHPTAITGATGYYCYISQAGAAASTSTRQQTAGSPTAIGTNFVLSAPPTTSGVALPTQNTTGTSAPVLTVKMQAPGAWGNNIYFEVVPGSNSATDATASFTLNLYQNGIATANLVESWPGISMNPNSPRYALSIVNATLGGSSYVSLSVAYAGSYVAGGSCDPASNAGFPTPLIGGADGSTAPTDAQLNTAITGQPNGTNTTYSGTGWAVTGLNSTPGNQVLNVNLPGADLTLVNAIIPWVTSQGNIFLVADGAFVGPSAGSAAIAASYTGLVTGASGSTINGTPNVALYGPWLSIPDPASSSPTATKWVAPGGAILGYWAQNDAQSSVAQTPAGVQATLVATALEAYFTPADLTSLRAAQVNPIKAIPNVGLCIFGGNTLAQGYPNQYLNVSRTLTQFIVDFQAITQYAIFQNNDSLLWASVTNTLTSYLQRATQAGMLASTDPASAFNVVCDATVNTPATAQAGIVNAQVMVALVSPAEYIIINLSQMSSGASTASVAS